MSEVKFKRYCRVSDFQRVYELCERLGDLYHSNGTDASFWEYAQTFGSFKDEYSHRIGLWEDDGKLIALATYEIDLGEAYFMLDPNYSYLSHSLIQYAEKYLTDNNSLTLNLSNAQTVLRESALKQGYSIKNKYPKKIYRFENGLLNTFLPDGFRFLDNKNEDIDYLKLDTCLHYGFDHDGEPDGDVDFRIHMHTTPHFNPTLPVIVIDKKSGDYIDYANAFIEESRKFAYLEPLCVIPQYRKKCIAKAIISEMIHRTEILGANCISGGSSNFYSSIGFDTVYEMEVWVKNI